MLFRKTDDIIGKYPISQQEVFPDGAYRHSRYAPYPDAPLNAAIITRRSWVRRAVNLRVISRGMWLSMPLHVPYLAEGGVKLNARRGAGYKRAVVVCITWDIGGALWSALASLEHRSTGSHNTDVGDHKGKGGEGGELHAAGYDQHNSSCRVAE